MEADALCLPCGHQSLCRQCAATNFKCPSCDKVAERTLTVFESARTCVVCEEAYATAVLDPCGHKCLCPDCADKISRKKPQCPICRTDFVSAITICDVFPPPPPKNCGKADSRYDILFREPESLVATLLCQEPCSAASLSELVPTIINKMVFTLSSKLEPGERLTERHVVFVPHGHGRTTVALLTKNQFERYSACTQLRR